MFVLRWLRSINPVGLRPLAVFQKEVRSSGRRRITYWARGLYALAFSAFIGLVLVINLTERQWQEPADRIEQMQQMAPVIAVTVMWFQFFGLLLATPLLLGPALCDERRSRTLPALLTTPLTSGQIVAGKLAAALVQLLILALIPLPLLLGMRVFGGLDVQAVIAGVLVTLASAVLAGSWALFASLNARGGISAAMVAWVAMAGLHGVLPIILFAMNSWIARTIGFSIPQWAFAMFSPPWAMGTVSTQVVGVTSSSSVLLWRLVGSSVGGSLAVSACLLFITAASLRSVSAATGGEVRALKADAPSEADQAPDTDPAAEPSDPTAKPRARKVRRLPASGRSRVVGERPVLWREVRRPIFRSRLIMLVIAIAAVVIISLIAITKAYEQPEFHQILATAGALVFAGLASIATTATISTERESRTLQVLLTAPLSSSSIIWGKFVGGLSRLWPLPAALAADLFILGTLGGCATVIPGVLYFGHIISTAVFLCAMGVLWSVLIRKSVLAGVAGLLFAASIWIIIPVLSTIFSDMVSDQSGEDVISILFSGNPVALAISSGLATPSSTDIWRIPREFQVANANYSAETFIWLSLGVWVMYGIASALALHLASRVFTRRRDALA